MSDRDPPGSVAGGYGWGEGREPGARRRKIYGYLKAANELRQSYQSQWAQRTSEWDDDNAVPGAYPDVEVARNGDEELLLFPSYARRHVKSAPEHRDIPGSHEDIDGPQNSGDAEYWKREWEKYEDDNAIVDVDVRGWIYAPKRGAMTRKDRLLVAVARRLSGIQAPSTSPSNSRASSRHSTERRLEDVSAKQEEELAKTEAQKIIARGEDEASAASRGGYSEEPGHESTSHSPPSSRSASPMPGLLNRPVTDSSLAMDLDDKRLAGKSRSRVPPEQMSKEELITANDHLMTRLKPFMTLPLPGIPITAFFYNDEKSQSRTVNTNESGHFSIRAALDFIPTNVRILASENLSVTEEVRITESKGVSLISDIDDTIKHSAITGGAKEIFRNTFIRDLNDLTVQGVKEWYSKMVSLGVKLHYVSNSPWQLYPLLRSYFGLAGLPSGSFHLKAYSGMLQGIFEPAAERKRGSLERIMRDFPERKFILVGDSGEADLEVYTDVVLENPGRVLAIFIRDVTTQEEEIKLYKERAHEQTNPDRTNKRDNDDGSIRSAQSDAPKDRPALPARRTQPPPKLSTPAQPTGNLIDLDDNPQETPPRREYSTSADLAELESMGKKQPPRRPSKPAALRGSPTQLPVVEPQPLPRKNSDASTASSKKSIPPPPPKPRRSGTNQSQSSTASVQRSTEQAAPRPASPSLRNTNTFSAQPSEGFVANAGRQISAAYNALPAVRGRIPVPHRSTESLSSQPSLNTSSSSLPGQIAPQPPNRRTITAYPALAAQYASNRLSWNPYDNTNASAISNSNNGLQPPNPNSNNNNNNPQYAQINRKEEIWRRRWERAEDMLRKEKVLLRSWRVGTEVMDDCVKVVEKAMADIEREERDTVGKGGR